MFRNSGHICTSFHQCADGGVWKRESYSLILREIEHFSLDKVNRILVTSSVYLSNAVLVITSNPHWSHRNCLCLYSTCVVRRYWVRNLASQTSQINGLTPSRSCWSKWFRRLSSRQNFLSHFEHGNIFSPDSCFMTMWAWKDFFSQNLLLQTPTSHLNGVTPLCSFFR